MTHYFDLSDQERGDLLAWGNSEIGLAREALEKDVWLCWALDALFRMPYSLPMAFKGGTSLSKVFDAIRRLSEDIDVSVDFRSLGEWPEDLSTMSRNQADRTRERLGQALRTYTLERVLPWMRSEAEGRFGQETVGFELDPTGEKLSIRYPSSIEDPFGYLRPELLLEFGGRNTTDPKESHTIAPYLAKAPGEFPSARVDVLSPVRTFWEKATLIHVECRKPESRTLGKGERMSRHWSDLAALADHAIGRSAVSDLAIATSVVRHKRVFFRDRDADYDACVSGGLVLVPSSNRRKELETDYRKMLDAGMFYGQTKSFGEIIDRLSTLQEEVNRLSRYTKPPDCSGGCGW